VDGARGTPVLFVQNMIRAIFVRASPCPAASDPAHEVWNLASIRRRSYGNNKFIDHSDAGIFSGYCINRDFYLIVK